MTLVMFLKYFSVLGIGNGCYTEKKMRFEHAGENINNKKK